MKTFPDWVDPAAAAAAGITPTQLEVLVRLADGLTYEQIARRCGIAEATMRGRLRKMFRRFGVSSSVALVVAAYDRGIFRPRHADSPAERAA